MAAHDPKSNRIAREEAKRKKPPESLDPPFPYRRETFDPFYFGLEKQPKKGEPKQQS